MDTRALAGAMEMAGKRTGRSLAQIAADISKTPPPPPIPESKRFFTEIQDPQPPRDSNACPVCGGNGWYLAVSEGNPNGKLARCRRCVDLLEHSRLTPEERNVRLDEIRDIDPNGSHTVLRFLGQELLADPYGWLVVYGEYGVAKSLLLTALVAEYCRRGTRAIYYHGKDLEQALFNDLNGDSQNRHLLRSADILAIDEFHACNVKSDWIAGEIGALLEERYRNQARQVTLIAMNADPETWTHQGNGTWSSVGPAIWSRMRDGRFVRPWPEDRSVPACLNGPQVPGVFRVAGPDVRPSLQREIYKDPTRQRKSLAAAQPGFAKRLG